MSQTRFNLDLSVIIYVFFPAARGYFLPGAGPDQEKNQRPQSYDGEGQAEPREGRETAREAEEEGLGAAAERGRQ